MSKVASENVISGKETLEETLEETLVDSEVVKDNLEEISKKVQNIENRLSEEQENIGKIIESVGEIQTEISVTKNMFGESSKGEVQVKQGNSICFFMLLLVIYIIFFAVGWFKDKISLTKRSLIDDKIPPVESDGNKGFSSLKSFKYGIISKVKSTEKSIIDCIKPRRPGGRKYANINAEDLFNQFRLNYKEKDKKWITLLIMMIIDYFIIPPIYICFLSNCSFLFSSLMIGPSVSCFAVLTKKYDKAPFAPFLVLYFWSIAVYIFSSGMNPMSPNEWLIYFFGSSLFLTSITYYEYTNYKDSSLSEAYKTLRKIMDNEKYTINQSSIDILIKHSSKIEDETFKVIKMLLLFLPPLGVTAFVKDYFFKYMKSLFERVYLEESKIFLLLYAVVHLIILFQFFYFIYKSNNSKADLYKSVLQDMQLTLALRGEKSKNYFYIKKRR